MVTVFTIPRAFEGDVADRQHNAVQSWLLSGYQIVLCGDDSGVVEYAERAGIGTLPDIARNEWGTPLISDVFAQVQGRLNGDLIAYVNADIMLDQSLGRAINLVAAQLDRFLIVGRRYDAQVEGRFDFAEGWQARFADPERLHGEFGLDYFGFRSPLWDSIPPMAVGRMRWDNWFLHAATQDGVATIDATTSVLAVHQEHGYEHIPAKHDSAEWYAHPEIARNLDLAGYCVIGTNSTRYELAEKGIRRK